MRKYFLLSSIILFFQTFTPDVFPLGDEIKFNHVLMGKGLSQNVINCIFQDREGFKWFGTQDGLFKYDGYDFKAYKSIPFDSTSLTDNWIQSITEDAKGNLWVGTYSGGLFEFNRDNQTFKSFRHDPLNNNSLINNRIWAVVIDKQGSVWVGTSGGLDKLDKEKNKFFHYVHSDENQNSISNNAVNSIYEDEKGCLWLGTWGGGLNKLDKEKNIFTHYFFGERNTKEFSDNYIKKIISGGDFLWLGTKRTLLKFDTGNGSVKRYFIDEKNISYPDENSILSLLYDAQKRLWIGTHDNGLYILNIESGSINNYKFNTHDPDCIRDNWISAIFIDSQGIFWFGTGKGIDKLLPYSKYFSHINGDSQRHNSLSSNEVNSIFEDHEGIVWIGTWNVGLNRYDAKTNKSDYYSHSVTDPNSLLNDIVWDIYEDSDNRLWIGTYAGVTIFDRKKGRFIRPPFKKNLLYNHNISSIYEDSRHYIWIGTWGGGLYRYDKKDNNVDSYLFNGSDTLSLSDNLITCMYEDSAGNLWIGTNAGGLNLFHYNIGKFTRFQYNPHNSKSLSNNNVSSIYQDSDGKLWIGTWGGGLNYLDQKTKTFYHFTEDDGLSNNIVFGILEDDEKYLWISSNQGLSRFSLKSHVFINYDAKDGLGNDQFSQGYLKLKDGHMMFGGVNGISVVYPDSIRVNVYKPSVSITSFKLFNKEKNFHKEISSVKNIILNYFEHDFSIEFSGLDYSRPDKNQYAYMLEGYDNNWIYIGNNRNAHYTNMAPGKYVFKVKAANRDNFWSEEPTKLMITIIPPFWKTWPFFLIVMFVLTAIIYLLHMYRVEQILKLERMRMSIATDLHDDIGASLTRISLFSDAALRSLKKLNIIKENIDLYSFRNIESLLGEIGENSRRLIGSMSDIVWTVNPQNDSFENITIRMMDYTAKLFEVNEIDYKITVDPELTALSLPMDFRRNLFLIYKESVSNIVRHAGATQVYVSLVRENSSLVMTIEDNGKGFENNGSSNGNGLKNIKKRTVAFGGTLSVSAREGKGTLLKAVMKLP